VPAVRVAADASTTLCSYPNHTDLTGGFPVIEATTRAEAEHWAARLAAACRCEQQLREFHFDPES
jgi:hypothetical protein